MTKFNVTELEIRHFDALDISQLLELMRELAKFENYIDEFVITVQDLLDKGLSQAPEFYALVASCPKGKLYAMAVYYFIPYTYTLKPNMVLKEFYVHQDYRGTGLGSKLFAELKNIASARECGQITWLVMHGNTKAEAFYEKQGASKDTKWQVWNFNLGTKTL